MRSLIRLICRRQGERYIMLRTCGDNRRRRHGDTHRIQRISAVYCFKRRACNPYPRLFLASKRAALWRVAGDRPRLAPSVQISVVNITCRVDDRILGAPSLDRTRTRAERRQDQASARKPIHLEWTLATRSLVTATRIYNRRHAQLRVRLLRYIPCIRIDHD